MVRHRTGLVPRGRVPRTRREVARRRPTGRGSPRPEAPAEVPMSESIDYKAAGVDLDTYEETIAQIRPLLKRTYPLSPPRVIEWANGFAGLFRLDAHVGLLSRTYRDPVLVASTDGVGTKLK